MNQLQSEWIYIYRDVVWRSVIGLSLSETTKTFAPVWIPLQIAILGPKSRLSSIGD
jgi:hypothetical protein